MFTSFIRCVNGNIFLRTNLIYHLIVHLRSFRTDKRRGTRWRGTALKTLAESELAAVGVSLKAHQGHLQVRGGQLLKAIHLHWRLLGQDTVVLACHRTAHRTHVKAVALYIQYSIG